MDAEGIRNERLARDRFLAEHYASPMPEEDQALFTGLSYFDHDPGWRIAVRYRPLSSTEIAIPSTSGTTSHYVMVGTVECAVDGSSYTLVVIDDGDGGSFIPFRDGTCGHGSYGGGRYVDIEVEGDTAYVDFNRARNPWCVYDEEFVCPLPPQENWITEAIPAGEMNYVRPL